MAIPDVRQGNRGSLSGGTPRGWKRVALGTVAVSAALGAAIPLNLAVILVPAALGGLFCAWRWPTRTVALAIVASVLHSGIYRLLRINVAGVPVSLYNVVPPLMLVSALSIRRTEPEAARAVHRTLKLVLVAVGAGIALGALIGFAEANARYLILQVLQLELQLFVVLIACLTAGSSLQWRRAVVRGIILGGSLAAVEILGDFLFTILTGDSFWSLFPFGTRINNLQGQIASGSLGSLRQNAVSAFLILPALALVATRLGRHDGILTGLFLSAGVVWLSRSFWAALAATMGLVLVFHLRQRQSKSAHLFQVLAPLVPIALVVAIVAGSILAQRFAQASSANVTNDQSNQFRVAETQAGLDRVLTSPFHVVFGLGTGTLVVHPYVGYRATASALLENGVLSEWVNGGLALVLGSALLFFGAGVRGWNFAARAGPTDLGGALGRLSLALPVLWLEGLVGGTLQVVEPTTILWLLAGTALAQRSNTRQPHNPCARWPIGARDGISGSATRHGIPALGREIGVQPRVAATDIASVS